MYTCIPTDKCTDVITVWLLIAVYIRIYKKKQIISVKLLSFKTTSDVKANSVTTELSVAALPSSSSLKYIYTLFNIPVLLIF